MNDLALSLLIGFAIAFPLAFIQLLSDSKKLSFKSLFTPQLWLYIFVSGIGNLVTTLIAAGIFDHGLTDGKNKPIAAHFFEGPPWVWYAFFGVFGFQALIKRVNISIYDKGVLAIDEWNKKAKDAALAAALKREADLEVLKIQQYADRLYAKLQAVPSNIHTIANVNLGSAEYSKILKELATRPSINIDFHLCYIIATKFPLVVKGVLKQP